MSVIEVIGILGFSFGLVRLGKFADEILGESAINKLKLQHNLEFHWLQFAKQSWLDLYLRAAKLAESALSRLFGGDPLSPVSIVRFSAFALMLNLVLAVSPLFSLYAGRAIPISVLKLWMGSTMAFMIINSFFDLIVYLITRNFLRSPPSTYQGIVLSLGIMLVIGWVTATISLVLGSTLVTLPVLSDPFSFQTLKLLFTVAAGWLPGQFLAPFHSNVGLQGMDIGYMAWGALPSLVVVVGSLVFMLMLKLVAEKFRYLLCRYLGHSLGKKTSLYEPLGFVASLLLIAFYGLIKCTLWVVA